VQRSRSVSKRDSLEKDDLGDSEFMDLGKILVKSHINAERFRRDLTIDRKEFSDGLRRWRIVSAQERGTPIELENNQEDVDGAFRKAEWKRGDNSLRVRRIAGRLGLRSY